MSSTGSAPGGDNLRCTDWMESEGAGQCVLEEDSLLLEKQGLRKPKCRRSGVAQGLKKGLGRHSGQVLRNLSWQYDSFPYAPGEPLTPT